MCPLRFILVFLSAVLAGFLALRTLKNSNASSPLLQPPVNDDGDDDDSKATDYTSSVRSAVWSGFRTCVDMASGRYLWRNLVAAPPPAAAASS